MTPTQPRRTTLLFLLSLLVPLLLAAVACDAISSKSSTSISGDAYESWSDLRAACQEREREIDDWEDLEELKLEEEAKEVLMDGDWFGPEAQQKGQQLMRKGQRVEREADAMRDELRDNCRAESERVFGRTLELDSDLPFEFRFERVSP